MSPKTKLKTVADAIAKSHHLLGKLRDRNVLSRSAYEAINSEIDEFFEYLRSIADLPAEDYWTEFRHEFGFARESPQQQYIPMNAANLCPEPTPLLNAMNQLRAEYNLNVAQQTRMGSGIRVEQVEATRQALAIGLGVPADTDDPKYDRLAILRNASEGNNAINCGYRNWTETTIPSERDNVVLWTENHPTNFTAWQLRAGWTAEAPDESLFEIREVNFPSTATDAEIETAFISQMDERTRFVSYSQTSNGSGFRIPDSVRQSIWTRANELGNCHVHVDGTMEWGAAAINLQYGHSFISSGHKWFLGPKQTGILYMTADKVANFEPSIFAYNYKIEVPSDWQDFPIMNPFSLRFEMLGQRDDVDIIVMFWTQEMWNVLSEIGLGDSEKDPYQRVQYLAQYLKTQLQNAGWTLVTPLDENRSRGVVRVEAPRSSEVGTTSLYDYIYESYHIAGSSGGSTPETETFRLCPHIYNNVADIDRAIEGMNSWPDRIQP